MANKNAVGIIFGVKGAGYPSGESYREINRGLNELIENIEKNDPKKITLHFQVDGKNVDSLLKGSFDKINDDAKNLSKSVVNSVEEQKKAFKTAEKTLTDYEKSLKKVMDVSKTRGIPLKSGANGDILFDTSGKKLRKNTKEYLTRIAKENNEARKEFLKFQSETPWESQVGKGHEKIYAHIEKIDAAEKEITKEVAKQEHARNNALNKLKEYLRITEQSGSLSQHYGVGLSLDSTGKMGINEAGKSVNRSGARQRLGEFANQRNSLWGFYQKFKDSDWEKTGLYDGVEDQIKSIISAIETAEKKSDHFLGHLKVPFEEFKAFKAEAKKNNQELKNQSDNMKDVGEKAETLRGRFERAKTALKELNAATSEGDKIYATTPQTGDERSGVSIGDPGKAKLSPFRNAKSRREVERLAEGADEAVKEFFDYLREKLSSGELKGKALESATKMAAALNELLVKTDTKFDQDVFNDQSSVAQIRKWFLKSFNKVLNFSKGSAEWLSKDSELFQFVTGGGKGKNKTPLQVDREGALNYLLEKLNFYREDVFAPGEKNEKFIDSFFDKVLLNYEKRASGFVQAADAKRTFDKSKEPGKSKASDKKKQAAADAEKSAAEEEAANKKASDKKKQAAADAEKSAAEEEAANKKASDKKKSSRKSTQEYREARDAAQQLYSLRTKYADAFVSGKLKESDGVVTGEAGWEAEAKAINEATAELEKYNSEIARAKMTEEEKTRLSSFINRGKSKEALARSDASRRSISDKDEEDLAKIKEYYEVQKQLERIATKSGEVVAVKDENGNVLDFQKNKAIKTSEAISNLIDLYRDLKKEYEGISEKADSSPEFKKAFDKEKTDFDLSMNNIDKTAQSRYDKLSERAKAYMKLNEQARRDPGARKMMDDLDGFIKESTGPEGYDKLKEKLVEIQRYLRANNLETETWFQKMKKTFGTRVRSLFSGLILGKVTMYLREVYKNVSEIDGALTQLKIVTGASETQMKQFLSGSISLAKQLGSSVKEVLNSIETFSRLGYDLEESSILAKYSAIMSKVAGAASEEAVKGLTSITKGYGFDVDQSEHVADVLVEVGQKYAVSASELITAYQKSGSALNATGTSFEKSAGLIAAGNAAVQNAEVVGTALKTVSARIRKSTTELNELGENTDELSRSFSKYAEEIETITGFSILKEGTKDTYKDLYDIFEGISKKWDELSDTQRTRVAEILGGTRQYQVISSILSNWGDAAGAYQAAMNSAGASTEAMNTYLDSIEGKIGQLKATFEELSTKLLSSDAVKTIVELLQKVVTAITNILSAGNSFVLKHAIVVAAIVAVSSALMRVKAEVMALKNAAGTFSISEASGKGFTGFFTMLPKLISYAKTKFKEWRSETTGEKASLGDFGISKFMLATTAIAGAAAIVVGVLKSIDKAWEEAHKAAVQAAEDADKKVQEYDKELNSLEELQSKLKDAYGSRYKLSQIYDELNSKIGVSSKLLNGEADAYAAANLKLSDRIEYYKSLKSEAIKTATEANKGAFSSNYLVRGTGWFADLVERDLSPEDISDLMITGNPNNPDGARGRFLSGAVTNVRGFRDLNGYSDEEVQHYEEFIASLENGENFYDAFVKLTEEEQTEMLGSAGFTKENWDKYWSEQVSTALNAFSDSINSYDGFLGGDGLSAMIKDLVLHGYNLEETGEIINDVTTALGDDFSKRIDDYYLALTNGGDATAIYDEIIAKLDALKERYPALTKVLDGYTSSITKNNAEIKKSIEVKTVSEMLEEVQGKYDAIVSAMNDMAEYDMLTAATLKTFSKEYPELMEYLGQTERGYRLNTSALKEYVEALIEKYKAEMASVTMTAANKKDALAQFEQLRAVIATLAATSTASLTGSDARKKALDNEKEALNKQLDAYKELIELRKKLLKQYQEEVEYKKELEKKQKKLAKLQTQYTVSQLDTSASGRSKTRELAKELAEAEEDLEDFTLEHAIDEITNQLDEQYNEYKNWIDGKLNGIEDALQGIEGAAEGVTREIASSMQTLLGSLDQIITEIKALEPVEAPRSGYARDTISEKRTALSLKGVQTVPPEAFYSGQAEGLRSRFKTYEAYINAIYGEKFSTHHSGGIVGELAKLKSTEEFAKLLKGEFVSTPAQMERFMKQTLPDMVSIGNGGVEINSPLVTIQCDNVTQDALPKLKQIVDSAVERIKDELDSGMSRAGYKKTAKKITI